MEPTKADDPADSTSAASESGGQPPAQPAGVPAQDPLLQAGIELLKAMPAAEDHACRHCGRPAGLFEECQRCFLDRLESQFDELMGAEGEPAPGTEQPAPSEAAPEAAAEVKETEDEPEAEPDPEPAPEPAVAAVAAVELPPAIPHVEPPEERRRFDKRGLLALLAAAAVLVAAVILIFQGSSSDVTPASSEPPVGLTGLGTDPDPAAQIIGTWSGPVEISYDSGYKDQMNQLVTVKRLNEGGPAGFSRSRQNGGTCNGPLTFLGFDAGSYRFRYEELNTDECIANGTVALTPGEDGTLVYKEVTRDSVNRGVLTGE